jgi:hypothetical protein
MKKRIVGVILALAIFFPVPFNEGQERPVDATTLYSKAMELYVLGNYQASLETFSQLIRSFPNSPPAPSSHYMIGECYLRMGRYGEAIPRFEFYIKLYPKGYRVKEAEAEIRIAKQKLEEKIPPVAAAPLPVTKESIKDSPPPPPKRTRRRVCSQVFSLEAKTFEDVERRMRELKKAGVDTLIVRTFQTKGDRIYRFATPRHDEGVYFKTDHAPVVDDILGKLIEIGHRHGLDIFAWITTRDADFGSDGSSDHRCKSYNFGTKKMEEARGYTLFNPDVLKRLEGLFRDLGRYPLDGILFQDDLILKHNEDFSIDAVRAFWKEFGYDPHPDLFYVRPYKSKTGKYYVEAYTDRFRVWATWKNRWLMNVAQRLMAAARESNPNVEFAINLYYEAVLNPSHAVAWFSQTLSEALTKEFDYYAVMAYHRQTMSELNLDDKKAIQLMAEVAQKAVMSVGDPSRVMMKIQVLDWKNYGILPKAEIEQMLSQILAHGQVSLAFVPDTEQFPLHMLKGKGITSDR